MDEWWIGEKVESEELVEKVESGEKVKKVESDEFGEKWWKLDKLMNIACNWVKQSKSAFWPKSGQKWLKYGLKVEKSVLIKNTKLYSRDAALRAASSKNEDITEEIKLNGFNCLEEERGVI